MSDTTGTEIVMPLATVIRLYGIVPFETERAGLDWDARCKALVAAIHVVINTGVAAAPTMLW